MDTQDLVRSHSTGHDSHGVHVCRKCGWPFPNAHPSARHRRAHKRVCGTIDGYKLTGSEEKPLLNASDDEHSDEERKTPGGPKVLERSDTEFSDAVAEFSDSGSGAGNPEGVEDVRESATSVERVAKNDWNAIQSHNEEITENTSNQLGYAPEFRGSLSISNVSSVANSESPVQDDRNGSEDDIHPIKQEMLTDASEDSKNARATDSVIESSLTSISLEGKMRESEASNLDRNLPISPIVASETAEGVVKLEGAVDITSDSVQDNEVVPSEIEHSNAFDLYTPQVDLPPEVESVEHVNAFINAAENKVDITDGVQNFSSGGLNESSNWKGEGNANVHVLSVPDDIHVVDNPEEMLEGFRNHREEKSDQPTFLDSWESFNHRENDVKYPVSNENFQFFQSNQLSGGSEASSDMHDLEATHELNGGSSKTMFTEVSAEDKTNVSQSEIKVTENQSSDEIAAPADSKMPQIAKSYTIISPEGHESYCNESLQANFSESDTNVLSDANSLIASSNSGISQITGLAGSDDNVKDEKYDFSGDHSSKGPAEENIVANAIASLDSTITPNIIGDAGYPETEKYKLAGDPASNLESASCPSELQVGPSTSQEVGDASDYEKDKTERCDIIGDDGDREKAEKYAVTGDDYSEVFIEKIVEENRITSLESSSSPSELKVNPATNLHDGDDSGELGRSVISGKESTEGSAEENLLVKPKLILDSNSNSGQVDVNKVSDAQKNVTENEIDCNDRVLLEVVSTASGSDYSPDVKQTQNSQEDCGMKEVGLSSLGAESSVVSFTAAEDNCTREFPGVSSGLSSQSLQEESDKNSVKQQLSPPALDVVDTNSQADSLEGNWGSVSVLSIQSDAQAVADSESEKKSRAASEIQYPDKSDMFEAPSFMTLVEPGGVVDQKATGTEIQTAHNPGQPKPAPLQAGWFPSITHVVNESPGRKKNEEIIAKVTNWSTGKQHTPLKNLLGEAYLENKAKSSNPKESQAPVPQNDDIAVKVKNSGPVATTVNSILAPPESPKENAKEWNSLARYPSDIKSEKRKAKGKPMWAQFLCCSSSVHKHP